MIDQTRCNIMDVKIGNVYNGTDFLYTYNTAGFRMPIYTEKTIET